jgi:hypothetical protein
MWALLVTKLDGADLERSATTQRAQPKLNVSWLRHIFCESLLCVRVWLVFGRLCRQVGMYKCKRCDVLRSQAKKQYFINVTAAEALLHGTVRLALYTVSAAG